PHRRPWSEQSSGQALPGRRDPPGGRSPVGGSEMSATLTRKDFATNQDVRWCPGCGDYSILAQVQNVFPTLGIPREKFVIVSGIGCSSRFPYYMNTYGFHSIHGRAPAMATGSVSEATTSCTCCGATSTSRCSCSTTRSTG